MNSRHALLLPRVLTALLFSAEIQARSYVSGSIFIPDTPDKVFRDTFEEVHRFDDHTPDDHNPPRWRSSRCVGRTTGVVTDSIVIGFREQQPRGIILQDPRCTSID